MGKFIDRTGQTHGKLLVESLVGMDKRNGAVWNCVCECGNRIVCRGGHLNTGNTTSCGHCPNRIEHFGDAIIIWLEYKGREIPCWIDATDYPLVKDRRWHVLKKKDRDTLYAACHAPDRTNMHSLIRGKGADHRDGDVLNNRRENLRPSTNAENLRNRGKQTNNTTGFKGVYRQGRNFCYEITVNGKKYRRGTFNTALEAARAYNEAAKKYHGEFAYLNDVGDSGLIFNQS